MKNLLSFVVGLIIGAGVFYFFGGQEEESETMQKMATPKGLISPSEAKTMDQAFNVKHNIINDSLFKNSTDGGDNRSSWYALEEIESYLAYSKNQAKELGFTMDGLRVYLGSYPDSKEQTGYTTMFFIPTGYKNTSEGAIFTFPQGGGGDITGADGLNKGSNGNPPPANYPQ